jgi:hypothetical protein
MNRTYIDNHHVVARYLADKLSEDERRAFEEYFIANPEMVKEIEAAARIKVGLHKLSETGEMESLLKPDAWYRSPGFLAMAASIMIVAIGVAFWFGRGAESPGLVASIEQLRDRSGQTLSLGDSYAILRTRSISYDAEIDLPATPQAIELRVLPEVEAQPPRYRIAIARVGDDASLTPIGDLVKLAPAEDGFVPVFLDSSRLSPGRYQLTISGDAGTSAAADVSLFRIRIRPSAQSPSP